MRAKQTVSTYLINQLHRLGVGHVFGVPGDYILSFFHEIETSELKLLTTCDEQGAGFAADAYARINGLGVVCITYCVGGLKVANTTAQAYAEKSPVVVISGAPGRAERMKTNLLHHKVRDFDTQLKVFKQFTVASTVLDDPQTACREIDRVLDAALRHKRPVYIELPRDMVSVPVRPGRTEENTRQTSEPHVLEEALGEALLLISGAKKPVILAGVELHRFGLQELLFTLLEKTGIPVASTILSKSVVREDHPLYIGVYEGAMGREDVRNYVESSDCLILLGTFMTDINLGIFSARLDQGRSIYVTSEKISIHYHTYENVVMEDFITGLLNLKKRRLNTRMIPHPPAPECPEPAAGKPVSVHYLFQRLNAFIDDETIVITDTGDAMFAAIDMTIHSQTEFLAPAYYTSLGFAVPASVGAQCARPDLRPLVVVGDGAFQMTGMEISTIVKYGLNPIIVVLNNQGYGTERPMLDGRFNDVHEWRYSRIPDIMGTGRGFDIRTEDELEHALCAAAQTADQFCILDVHLDRGDFSQALQRLTSMLRKRIG